MYKTIAGDTFESISRKVYGTESQANRIAAANPGVSEPISTGITLVTPAQPGVPKNKTPLKSSVDHNEVIIEIADKVFRNWTEISFVHSLDQISQFSFSAPFESGLKAFRDLFKPFEYKNVFVSIGSENVFTGTIVNVIPSLGQELSTVRIDCYSLPGVLNDCTPPASSFPIEFNKQDLKAIAEKLCLPFGMNVLFKDGIGGAFERVALTPGKTVLEFLIELAKQRGLIITNDSDGSLIFYKSISSGSPVARFEQGQRPLESVIPILNSQAYYSHITGIEPVKFGSQGKQFTVKNTRLDGIIRPFVFQSVDTPGGDVQASVRAKAARMFGDSFSVKITVPTWRNVQGNLWQSNTFISLLAPDAMIYSEYKFLLRTVTLNKNDVSETANLDLVLPGAYSGEIPESFPWEN